MLPEQRRTPPYLPFLQGAVDFTPRLKPIPLSEWVTPDPEAHWLTEKHGLMRGKRDLVCGGDLSGEASRELADTLDSSGVELAQGWPSPLEAAAASVSDDLCLLQAKRPGDWRLIAGVLAAPTYWTLPERIGLDLGGLHGPVPGGDPELASRIGRIFTALKPDTVLERFNWTVQVGGQHHTPHRPSAAGAEPQDLYLRVERQTIRKLSKSHAVVFTIRICIDPLLPILQHADHREAFEDAWLTASVDFRGYKAWPELDRVVRVACRRASQSALYERRS